MLETGGARLKRRKAYRSVTLRLYNDGSTGVIMTLLYCDMQGTWAWQWRLVAMWA